MTSEPVDFQAAASCARRIGTAEPAVIQQGVDHVVFDAGAVIVKCGTRDPFGIEAWALARADALGVPTPSVVSLDTTSAMPHLAITKVDGVTLFDSRLTAPVAERGACEAGELLRQLHTESMSGFGWTDRHVFTRDAQIVGKSASWPEEIHAELDPALEVLTAHSVLSPSDAESVRTRLREATPLLSIVTDGRFLHGDLGRMHILVDPDDGRMAGLVDWGDLQIGDPLWDLAITECHLTSPSEGMLRRHRGGHPNLFAHVLDGYQLSDIEAERFSALRAFYLLYRRAWVAALEAGNGSVPEALLTALHRNLR